MTRRIFVDTEWTARPWSDGSELMWIGLADEDGYAWSAISAEADIDDVPGVWRYISPDDPRSTADEIAAGIIAFCGDVDEFWAWIPTLKDFATWFDLGDDAPDLYARYRDVDLQMMRSLIEPWPHTWPDRLHDLNATAVEAGVRIPPWQANQLAPEVHAVWNRRLFDLILRSRKG